MDEFLFGTRRDDLLRDASPKFDKVDSFIYGYEGDDRITSCMGDDQIRAGEGDDEITLYFNPWKDIVIHGGKGQDLLTIHHGEHRKVIDMEEHGRMTAITFSDGQVIKVRGVEDIQFTHDHPWDY